MGGLLAERWKYYQSENRQYVLVTFRSAAPAWRMLRPLETVRENDKVIFSRNVFGEERERYGDPLRSAVGFIIRASSTTVHPSFWLPQGLMILDFFQI